MSVIYALLVGHFVADFICQSDWMAVNKSKRWDALAWHVIAYGAALIVVMSPWISSTEGAIWLLVNMAVHFAQDAITSRLTSKLWFFRQYGESNMWWQSGGSRHWFFVAIGFDQLLHYVTLFVTAEWWLK